MLFDVESRGKGIAILRVTKGGIHARSLPYLGDMCGSLAKQGKKGVLLDLGGVKRISAGGLAAMVELTSICRDIEIGYCRAPKKLDHLIESLGLYRGLQLFADVDTALRSNPFRSLRLAGVQGVVFNDARPRGLLDRAGPYSLLDVLGKPLLQRVFEQLGSVGCRQVFANVPEGFEDAPVYFSVQGDSQQCQFFVRDGRYFNGAGTFLDTLKNEHFVLSNTCMVLRGDRISDADLSLLYERHQDSGADITFWGDSSWHTGGNLADRTVCEVGFMAEGACLEKCERLKTVQDFYKMAVARKLRVEICDPIREFVAGSSQEYFSMLPALLDDPFPDVVPVARNVGDNIWLGDRVQIPKANTEKGPVYIAQGAMVSPQAKLIGPAFVGRGAKIGATSVVRNSSVFPGAVVPDSNLVDGKLVMH